MMWFTFSIYWSAAIKQSQSIFQQYRTVPLIVLISINAHICRYIYNAYLHQSAYYVCVNLWQFQWIVFVHRSIKSNIVYNKKKYIFINICFIHLIQSNCVSIFNEFPIDFKCIGIQSLLLITWNEINFNELSLGTVLFEWWYGCGDLVNCRPYHFFICLVR